MLYHLPSLCSSPSTSSNLLNGNLSGSLLLLYQLNEFPEMGVSSDGDQLDPFMPTLEVVVCAWSIKCIVVP